MVYLLFTTAGFAGPYSPGKGGAPEAGFPDAGVAGFSGPAGEGVTANGSNGNFVNPIYFGWADSVVLYDPSDVLGPYGINGIGRPPNYFADFGDPAKTLGEVTGNVLDIVSLGDMDTSEITAHLADSVTHPLGTLTLQLASPIENLTGADFTTFENGFVNQYNTSLGSVAGQITAELGYVEVSSDGINFLRFPSHYLNSAPTGTQDQLTQDASNIYNLTGKHSNAYGESWGTPFDLEDLATDPLVVNGTVDLNNILYVRIVDIPGDGTFTDASGNPIYDAWVTWGSGGLDFEALGVISRPLNFAQWPQLEKIPNVADRDPKDDPDEDGWTNLEECALAMLPWKADEAPMGLSRTGTGGTSAFDFFFVRDERLRDVTYEVWASPDMVQWDCIATSTGGQELVAEPGFSPVISETGASSTTSVGVLRQVQIRNGGNVQSTPRQFYQLVIKQTP